MDFFKETHEAIKELGKTVDWIGSYNGKLALSKEAFFTLENINYDSGYGSSEIAMDLVVVFTDGSWLHRHEYDGAEGWEYNKTPVKQKDFKSFSRYLIADGWEQNLEKLN